MNVWTEHRNPEGRTYWFNTGTRESVWEKPDVLKTPFERALNETKWKEYFSGGRKYFYNTETKESKWDMPDELKQLMDKVEKEGSGQLVTIGSIVSTATLPIEATPQNNMQVGAHTGGAPSNGALPSRPNFPEDPVIPHNGFATYEEGEKAFMHLLRKAGVDPTWTWDQTMRGIITDPLYRALNSLSEKKAVFEKYTTSLITKEKEEREARLAKLRPALRNMLKGNPNVFHYSTFATADKLFSQHPIWQTARIEAERKLIFEEYVADLQAREQAERAAARTRATAKVVSLFKQLGVDAFTRWRSAHSLLLESEEFKADPELQKLPPLDILLAFEDFSRIKEREFDDLMRREQVETTRKRRRAREGFKALLQELVDAGKIKARTKWKEVYPLFSNDERYLNMLGNPGSNQLELFWDVVDQFDQQLDAKIASFEDAMKEHDPEFVVTAEMSVDDFKAATAKLNLEGITDDDVKEMYTALNVIAVKKQAEEKRRAERKVRHMQDDLRYALKKLSDPIDLNASYEESVPLMSHLPEYKALVDEEARRAAFSKFVKRQKERQREAEASEDVSTTSRKRKEPARDRDDRDHDRDYRGSSGRHRDSHYDRDRERDYDRDRDYRSSRHDDRRRDRDRKESKYASGDVEMASEKREREKDRDMDVDEGPVDKKPRLELDKKADDRMDGVEGSKVEREDTPEEGEI